jgi:hypothetical protein
MSAFGRLWTRAPLWRWSLMMACAGLLLSVVYPPGWLGGTSETPIVPPQRPAVTQAAPPIAVPVPAQPGAPLAGARMPTVGESYSNSVPLGVQSVPLPMGRWTVIAVSSGNSASGLPVTSAFLGLPAGGRIAAAAVISGSVAPEPREAGFAASLEPQIPPFYYRRVVSAVDHGRLDFWVCGTTAPARWNDALRQAAVGALRQQNLALPERMDSAVFRFADKRNWLLVEFMFVDSSGGTEPVRPWIEAALQADPVTLAHIEKVRRWGKTWHDVLRRGFTGTLAQGEATRIGLP